MASSIVVNTSLTQGAAAVAAVQPKTHKPPKRIGDVDRFPNASKSFTHEECERIRDAVAARFRARIEAAEAAAAAPVPAADLHIEVELAVVPQAPGDDVALNPPSRREEQNFEVAVAPPVQPSDAVYLPAADRAMVQAAVAEDRARSNRYSKAGFCCLCLVISAVVATIILTNK